MPALTATQCHSLSDKSAAATTCDANNAGNKVVLL